MWVRVHGFDRAPELIHIPLSLSLSFNAEGYAQGYAERYAEGYVPEQVQA